MENQARLALIARVLGSTAHELNNPLTTIAGFSQLIAARTEDAGLRADLAEVLEASASAGRYVAALGALAKGSDLPTVDLAAALDDALTLVAYELRAARVTVQRQAAGPQLPLPAPSGAVLEVLLHLLTDALEAFGGTGQEDAPRRRLEISARADADAVVLTLVAHGAGSRARWLGMDRCSDVVRLLGGTVEQPEAAAGARTTHLRLPRA